MITVLHQKHLKVPDFKVSTCIIRLRMVMIVMDSVLKRIISGKQQKKGKKIDEIEPELDK